MFSSSFLVRPAFALPRAARLVMPGLSTLFSHRGASLPSRTSTRLVSSSAPSTPEDPQDQAIKVETPTEPTPLEQTELGYQRIKKPPVATSSLPDILYAGHPVVDKTVLIGNLFHDYERVFLARPRKWGKTTLLSTMKMILEGGDENRNLLKDFDIVKRASEFPLVDWKPRPVLVFDFSNLDESRKQRPFLDVLMDMIREMTQVYEIDIHKYDYGDNVKFFFALFLRRLRSKFGTQVSVLVDEYDAPILNALEFTHLSEKEKRIRADENRQTLRDFFTSLKSMDAYTYRCFTTGLNKFAMTGMFSGANDFKDITFHEEFSVITGYTWKEIETSYAPLLDRLAEKLTDKNRDELRKLLQENYGGYSWLNEGTEETRLFNPWDINNCLAEQVIVPYWTKNGLSSRLLNLIDPNFLRRMDWTDREYSLSRMESLVELSRFVPQQFVDSARLLVLNGYLTIKSGRFAHRDWVMKIGFPNGLIAEYVYMELTKLLLRVRTDDDMDDLFFRPLQACLSRDDVLALFSTLRSLFARTPYHISHQFLERHVHTMLFQMLSLAWGPSRVLAEVPGQESRADLVIETDKATHMIELKVVPPPKKKKTSSNDDNNDDNASPKEPSLSTAEMTADRMSPQLTDAIGQLQNREYQKLARRPDLTVRRYAVVYHSNLKLMDAVEIDENGKVSKSVWDEDVEAEPIVSLASPVVAQESQDSTARENDSFP